MRKSPTHHPVREHTRDGKHIHEYERGKGVKSQRKSRVVGVIGKKYSIRDLFVRYHSREFGGESWVRKLLDKGIFIEGDDVEYLPAGKLNDCETNSYRFAKARKGYRVVIGSAEFSEGGEDYWVGRHHWVLSPEGKHIDVTPNWEASLGRVGRIVKRENLKIPLSKWGSFSDSRMYE